MGYERLSPVTRCSSKGLGDELSLETLGQQFPETRVVPIAGGEDRMGNRPGYSQVWIIPCHTAGVRSVVVGGDLIVIVGHIAQNAVHMRHSARQEEGEPVRIG